MPIEALTDGLERTYTGFAFGVTILSGLLTIMVERFVYRRRGYKREAAITSWIGWFYVLGGTALYLALLILARLV